MIFVTGGAGYIGSHFALACRAQNRAVVVLDDLSRGFGMLFWLISLSFKVILAMPRYWPNSFIRMK